MLQAALINDAANAIDVAIEFIDSGGVVNRKTKAAFNRWKMGTIQLFFALMRLQPHLDREKIGALLEQRLIQLYYFVQSITLYKAQPTSKNANLLNTHQGSPRETSLEISDFLRKNFKI